MNKLLLDSANIADMASFLCSDAVAGVTTNPSLVAKEKREHTGQDAYVDYFARCERFCETVFYSDRYTIKHLSVEVVTLDPESMYSQAMKIMESCGKRFRSYVDIHIKIPVMVETLPIITRLAKESVKVNATACMTAPQAVLAADAGATVVSFFYNRMIDGLTPPPSPSGHFSVVDPREEARKEITTFKMLRRKVPVICGSIRKKEDVMECWLCEADYVTASAKIIREIIEHPKTVEAVNQFQADIDTWLK